MRSEARKRAQAKHQAKNPQRRIMVRLNPAQLALVEAEARPGESIPTTLKRMASERPNTFEFYT